MFLLDTVIISELRKSRPDSGVVRWISARQDDELFISVVTLGEIEKGVEKQRARAPQFATELAVWLEELIRLYADRILAVTPAIARTWGRLAARIGNDGADLLIAATALENALTVVTRNSGDFAPTGVNVFNPFDGRR